MDLVEREAALQTLHERLGQASGRGHVVLLCGEAVIDPTTAGAAR